ncbi:hypothetical protein ACQ4PT_069458 [Festuca glaucescens]
MSHDGAEEGLTLGGSAAVRWVRLMQIDKFHDKVFDVDTVAEFNRKLWVGGCLPLLTIVYMDFLHFPNGGGPHDLGVPWIQHVVSADFISVHNLDRKRTSRKSYGLLQIKDISLTPYAAIGIGAALPGPILVDIEEVSVVRDDGGSNAPIILDTPESENIISNAHTYDATIPRVSPSANPSSDVASGQNVSKTADVGSLIKGLLSKHESKWMEMNERATKILVTEIESVISAHCHGCGVVHHVLDNRTTSPLVEKSDVALLIDVVIPPVGQQDCPVSKQVDLQSSSNHFAYVAPVMETSDDIDSGLKIAMSYADIPSNNQVVDALSIVISPNPNCSFSAHVPIPSMDERTGQSTLDKRNHKKRVVKIVSPDLVLSKKVKVDVDVDCFYSKFVRNNDLSPDFIDFGDFTVPSEHFYNSHKPRGDVANEVTNLNTVFQKLHIDSKNLPSFKKFNPSDYPRQTTLHDCGFYVLMYIEHWTGKVMLEFRQGPVLHYRMNMAYRMFHCEANMIKIGSLDALKKRKKM